jgi:hypothetical protein
MIGLESSFLLVAHAKQHGILHRAASQIRDFRSSQTVWGNSAGPHGVYICITPLPSSNLDSNAIDLYIARLSTIFLQQKYLFSLVTMPSQSEENGTMYYDGVTRVDTAQTINITKEMFEKLYLQPQNRIHGDLRRTFGNPTPLCVTKILEI